MDDLARVLALTVQELEADDARLELGGRDPSSDTVWCPVGDGPYRLVVVYDGPPPQPVEVLRDRLRLLAGSFASTLSAVRTPATAPDPQRSLDDALEVLAQQTRACDALVVDETSPMIWGASDGERGPEDVLDAERGAKAWRLGKQAGVDLPSVLAGEADAALPNELARLVTEMLAVAEGTTRRPAQWRRRLRMFAAIAALRERCARHPGGSRWSLRESEVALLGRGFGGIYWLLLVFDDPDFSELHAEAAMIHAAPWIERLVTALPPVDPDGKGGRVVKLRRLRRL